ncbi:hypothetical protein [Bacillus pseudomycoides]|uniref:hypothetical protein n=1 Tax=Bacillus pseudomycoides TaxID=64104 RepID=UPI00059B5BC5|nr:hypothetical protein [Bacillus pseudomycoides]MCR8861188.1 hypothetical protein [Bacillus pseudomycoides]PHE28506.1 hypothetical protein COF51_28375 [Bacillus pseudomycoides]
MENLMRELKNEELEKHKGGINVKIEMHTDDGGHRGGLDCSNLRWLCAHGYTQQCNLVLQFCKH